VNRADYKLMRGLDNRNTDVLEWQSSSFQPIMGNGATAVSYAFFQLGTSRSSRVGRLENAGSGRDSEWEGGSGRRCDVLLRGSKPQ
jgi:hypothetical protein